MTGVEVPAAKTRWLESQWEFVRSELPPAPARIIDLGCGPYGGFVPMLRRAGYDAIGVDPKAPAEPGYHQRNFEQLTAAPPADAVIACTSLHHTDDLAAVLDHISAALRPGAPLVVIEWDWLRFDERTARWCFDRLSQSEEPGWLHRHRDRWRESSLPWQDHLTAWATEEHLHNADALVTAFQRQFTTRHLSFGPYFFADLDGVSPEDERIAIEVGQIQATGIRFVGTSKEHRA
jgi:SAM-dependent methyltransferase